MWDWATLFLDLTIMHIRRSSFHQWLNMATKHGDICHLSPIYSWLLRGLMLGLTQNQHTRYGSCWTRLTARIFGCLNTSSSTDGITIPTPWTFWTTPSSSGEYTKPGLHHAVQVALPRFRNEIWRGHGKKSYAHHFHIPQAHIAYTQEQRTYIFVNEKKRQ